MAPINVDLISTVYETTYFALSKGKDAAITAAFNACGIPDPGFVAWVIGKILDCAGLDAARAALAIAIALEYAKRSGSIRKGMTLTNHCSACHCKGHNITNHVRAFDDFLIAKGLQSAGDDVNGALGSLA